MPKFDKKISFKTSVSKTMTLPDLLMADNGKVHYMKAFETPAGSQTIGVAAYVLDDDPNVGGRWAHGVAGVLEGAVFEIQGREQVTLGEPLTWGDTLFEEPILPIEGFHLHLRYSAFGKVPEQVFLARTNADGSLDESMTDDVREEILARIKRFYGFPIMLEGGGRTLREQNDLNMPYIGRGGFRFMVGFTGGDRGNPANYFRLFDPEEGEGLPDLMTSMTTGFEVSANIRGYVYSDERQIDAEILTLENPLISEVADDTAIGYAGGVVLEQVLEKKAWAQLVDMDSFSELEVLEGDLPVQRTTFSSEWELRLDKMITIDHVLTYGDKDWNITNIDEVEGKRDMRIRAVRIEV